ncbi:hypothetical protein HPB47_019357, partial [Ixodes persulcatus]
LTRLTAGIPPFSPTLLTLSQKPSSTPNPYFNVCAVLDFNPNCDLFLIPNPGSNPLPILNPNP